MVPGSRLIDAPARGLGLKDLLPLAGEYELAVLHTSTPSFRSDVRVAEALRLANPELSIGLVGAHVAVSVTEPRRAKRAVLQGNLRSGKLARASCARLATPGDFQDPSGL